MMKSSALPKTSIFIDWSNVYMRAKKEYGKKVLPEKIENLIISLFKDNKIIQTHMFCSIDENNEGQKRFFITTRKKGILVYTEKLVERPATVFCDSCDKYIEHPLCCDCGNAIYLSPHKSKKIDILLAVTMLKLSNTYDELILVSGDQDFIPAIKVLRNERGKKVYIASFKKALSHELITETNGSPIILDKYINKIKQ